VDGTGCAAKLFEEEARTLALEGVSFEYDQAVLTPESTLVLDRVAASLRDWPSVRVEIGGHTDSRGGDAYNLDLSGRRAQAVRDYLVRAGIDASRLTAKGYGASQPVADNATEAGRAKNRRVELERLD
jgi:OOP family OmpA-OmpF porin